MSKSSKSCSYTGHMKTMNRVNQAKINYSANSSQSHQAHAQIENKHIKHKADYPEVGAEMRAQAQCGCKK